MHNDSPLKRSSVVPGWWTVATVLLLLAGVCPQPAHAQLASHVETTTAPGLWNYTLFNDEPLTSPNFVTGFQVNVSAPVSVTGTPTGWDFDTDGSTFVLWFSADTALPYPNDIAPGALLSGFQLSSTAPLSGPHAGALFGWDHTADGPGPIQLSQVLAPGVASPEPSSAALLVPSLLLPLLCVAASRRRQHTPAAVAA